MYFMFPTIETVVFPSHVFETVTQSSFSSGRGFFTPGAGVGT